MIPCPALASLCTQVAFTAVLHAQARFFSGVFMGVFVGFVGLSLGFRGFSWGFRRDFRLVFVRFASSRGLTAGSSKTLQIL